METVKMSEDHEATLRRLAASSTVGAPMKWAVEEIDRLRAVIRRIVRAGEIATELYGHGNDGSLNASFNDGYASACRRLANDAKDAFTP